jgi:hypothetical protein
MDALSNDPQGVARLREELERKTEEVRVLREVSSRLNATLKLEDIYDVVLHTMHDLFGFSHSLILLVDESGRSVRVAPGAAIPSRRSVRASTSASASSARSPSARR